MLERMHINETVLGMAMQASAARNAAISSNIANVDTPGYKREVVGFEKSLAEALDKATAKGVDLSGVEITQGKAREAFSWRIDKNNVDMESEMSALYQNSARFDALASCFMSAKKRLALAIMGR
ncbi:MAG: flagellar basal body rod protein FlgB [Clostridiales bacterium]|nr:flagellar basal body rod protein FlgB [Clostridiales bacterium]